MLSVGVGMVPLVGVVSFYGYQCAWWMAWWAVAMAVSLPLHRWNVFGAINWSVYHTTGESLLSCIRLATMSILPFL